MKGNMMTHVGIDMHVADTKHQAQVMNKQCNKPIRQAGTMKAAGGAS